MLCDYLRGSGVDSEKKDPMDQANRTLRLLMLSDLGSPHTQRWAVALANRRFRVMVVGLNPVPSGWCKGVSGLQVKDLGIPREKSVRGERTLAKLCYYLTAVPRVKRILRSFRPHILHAHYATSYGLLASTSGFHPWICSVWGSDVYSFPRKGLLHRQLLRFVLSRADQVCATSSVMAEECRKYTIRNIHVTPFGIDCRQFHPRAGIGSQNAHAITVGTIKSLEPNYRIDLLIRSFAEICRRHPWADLKLLIVGNGSQRSELESLVEREGLSGRTFFAGQVPHQKVAEYLRRLSVYVAVSASESFGVAVLEASACGIPVVVSRVGGLVEVVRDGETGLIVPPDNLQATTTAIEKLVMDPTLRSTMGAAGRRWVADQYNWERSVEIMLDVYRSVSNV